LSAIPRHLREQLRRHKVIPFIGAGVSCGVQDIQGGVPLFPDWKTLLEKIHEELLDQRQISAAASFKQLLEKQPPDFLGAAEIGWKNLEVPDCPGFLMDIFDVSVDRAKPESLELARSLWNLGSRILFTTNFDPVMEWVCPKLSDHRVVCTQNHGLAQILRDSSQTLYATWHLHGSVLHDVENIVFNQTQYEDFYYKTERIETTLRTFLSTKTILFIGFSLTDYYFCKNLEDINRIFGGAANSFYVLVKTGTRVTPLIRKMVVPIEFDDFEVGLPRLLNEMCELANPHAVEAFAENDPLFTLARQPSVSSALLILMIVIALISIPFSLAPPNQSPQKLVQNPSTGPQNADSAPLPAEATSSAPTLPEELAATKGAIAQKQIQRGAKKIERKPRGVNPTTEEALINRANKQSGATIKPSQ